MNIGGWSVTDLRRKLVTIVTNQIENSSVHYDLVAPIPNTGLLYSKALADELGLKHSIIFTKNSTIRTHGLAHHRRVMLNKQIISDVGKDISGKRLLFVDEAIVSGQTSKLISDLAFNNGAKSVGFAFMSPPTLRPCEWDLYVRDNILFEFFQTPFANLHENFCDYLRADYIWFPSIDEFTSTFSDGSVCKACFRLKTDGC